MGKLGAIYSDRGKHFDNQEIKDYMEIEGVTLTLGLSGSSKSFGMIEQGNGLLEDVLRKSTQD